MPKGPQVNVDNLQPIWKSNTKILLFQRKAKQDADKRFNNHKFIQFYWRYFIDEVPCFEIMTINKNSTNQILKKELDLKEPMICKNIDHTYNNHFEIVTYNERKAGLLNVKMMENTLKYNRFSSLSLNLNYYSYKSFQAQFKRCHTLK